MDYLDLLSSLKREAIECGDADAYNAADALYRAECEAHGIAG